MLSLGTDYVRSGPGAGRSWSAGTPASRTYRMSDLEVRIDGSHGLHGTNFHGNQLHGARVQEPVVVCVHTQPPSQGLLGPVGAGHRPGRSHFANRPAGHAGTGRDRCHSGQRRRRRQWPTKRKAGRTPPPVFSEAQVTWPRCWPRTRCPSPLAEGVTATRHRIEAAVGAAASAAAETAGRQLPVPALLDLALACLAG